LRDMSVGTYATLDYQKEGFVSRKKLTEYRHIVRHGLA
jgi:hypothetical protein